jgi:hypothetical protein
MTWIAALLGPEIESPAVRPNRRREARTEQAGDLVFSTLHPQIKGRIAN